MTKGKTEVAKHELTGLQVLHGTEMTQAHCPELIKNRNNVRVFTLAQYIGQAEKCPAPYDHGGDWDGDVSKDQSVRFAKNGHEATSNDVSGWLDSYTLGNVEGQAWVHSIAGSRVCVQDYLAGNPRHMRRRTKVEKQAQHVTVWVECVSSSGISATMLRNRGLAILAFVETLRMLRISVELNLICSLPTVSSWDDEAFYGVVHHVIQLDTNPLDLSTSGFCLSHPSWYRNVMYAVGKELDGLNARCPPPGQEHASFGQDGMYKSDEKYEPYVRERLGMGADDVYIPLPNYLDKMLADPKGWLNLKIKPYMGGVT
jgi:hypothetical protein